MPVTAKSAPSRSVAGGSVVRPVFPAELAARPKAPGGPWNRGIGLGASRLGGSPVLTPPWTGIPQGVT